ncbi:hypothetical protein LIA77_01748 [Sarocladium implicatum]|nr:hypothetical protein LIA77_01748 [Sarocladium implicatum]
MLRRRSARSRQHRPLNRSKSSHSVVRNPIEGLESVDPVIAKRDAHTAAILSFQRAQGVALPMEHQYSRFEDHAASGGLPCRRLNDHSIAIDSEPCLRHSAFTSDPSEPQRRQSVRLSGPKSGLKRNLAPRASRGHASSSGNDGGSETVQGQTLKSIAQVHGKGFGFHSLTRNYLRSIRASEAEASASCNDLHAPSGPGKLRKSRSMFTALDAENKNYFFSNGTSPPPQPEAGQVRRSRSRFAAINTNPDSLDKARGSNTDANMLAENTNGHIKTEGRPMKDAAVRLARDIFQQQVAQQERQKHHHYSLRPQSSLFFRSRNQRSESSMALRRSLRNSSNTSAEMSSAFSGQSLSASKHGGIRNTARKVSQSLRSRFKGFMTRPGLEQGSFQSYSHEMEFPRESECASEMANNDDQIGEVSMSRVMSHVPSLHAVPSFQQMQSRKGSVESLDTVEGPATDDRSRVTSWTNSITNTLPSQSAASEWEKQRLSVIKENGMHVSSSSLSRQSPGLSPQTVVNSDRVYAALMKRLEDSQGRGSQQGHQSTDGIAIPPRSSSVDPYESPTIRCIAADDDVFTDQTKSKKKQLPSVEVVLGETVRSTDGAHGLCEHSVDKTHRASPRSVRSKTISHRSSAFFGSPTTHLFRTTSPYRKALNQEMAKSNSTKDEEVSSPPYLSTLSPLVLPYRRPDSIASEKSKTKASSGSLYSCQDGECGSHHPNEFVSTVTQFPTPPTIEVSPAGQRGASAASSVEWKKWLSTDVARLQDSAKKVPGLGHVREQAEIESPDDRQGRSFSRTASAIQSTPLQIVTSKSRSSSAQKLPQNQQVAGGQRSENHRPTPLSTPVDPARWATVTTTPIQSAPRRFPECSKIEGNEAKGVDILEEWPLTDPDKLWAARGRPMPAGHHVRSPLSQVLASSPGARSPRASFAGDRGEDQQALGASSSDRVPSWDLDKTLQRLHIGGTSGKSKTGYLELPGPKADPRVSSSKRMVDMFLSSRRRKGSEKRSRSTSDGSPAFL